MAFYVLDENKNLVASFDREGFLAILQQAIAQGTLENIDPDSAVASKLRSNINGTAHYIEFVTAAQYSELETQGELVAGTYYFITDDTTEEDLENAISSLADRADSLETNVRELNETLSFGNPNDEFSVFTVAENGSLTRSAVPRGLFIARVYDQRNPSTPRIQNTLIVFYDGVGQCVSSVVPFLVFGVGYVNVQLDIGALGAILVSAGEEATPQNYTIELRQIGTTA